LASGGYSVEWDFEPVDTGRFVAVNGVVWFMADRFACSVCRLHLDSVGELKAAGMRSSWPVHDADPSDYEPVDREDAGYEAWRERGLEQT
jgi:hypothetical protein